MNIAVTYLNRQMVKYSSLSLNRKRLIFSKFSYRQSSNTCFKKVKKPIEIQDLLTVCCDGCKTKYSDDSQN